MNLARQIADRTVFVTGADGFVGSHLVERLVECDANVHAFVRASSSGGLRNVGHLEGDLTVHRGDLRDRHSIRRALRALGERSGVLVFHLGAQAHVGESWERPYETVDVNVNGTVHLLQGIVDLDLDVSRVVTAGSSEEYGGFDPARVDHYDRHEDGSVVLDERSPVEPRSIYATSKLAADCLTMNYHQAYGLPGVTNRMFNNYGPRQNPRYITGTVITQALERDVVELGNLESARDMCYVSDGVRGHLHVGLEGTAGERYVFGYGESVSMREWVELILDVGRREGYWEDVEVVQRAERYRPGSSEVESLLVSYDKLHEETGWEPTVSRREGLRQTIEWYAANRKRWRHLVDWR